MSKSDYDDLFTVIGAVVVILLRIGLFVGSIIILALYFYMPWYAALAFGYLAWLACTRRTTKTKD